MSTKLPTASTSIDGILLNTAQTINGDKQANVSNGQSWVFDRVYTASSTSNAIGLWQRTGGAVALAIGYSDSPIQMYIGTTTAHPLAFRTSNVQMGVVDANGIWNFGITTLSGSGTSVGHTMNGPFQLGGKRTSSGTWSLGGVATTAADDTERLAFHWVDTVLTSGTARFQYAANKAGSGVHGWGITSTGNMVFGRGTASTGFIDITTYAVVAQTGVWTFGPTNLNASHTFNGPVTLQGATGAASYTYYFANGGTGYGIVGADFANAISTASTNGDMVVGAVNTRMIFTNGAGSNTIVGTTSTVGNWVLGPAATAAARFQTIEGALLVQSSNNTGVSGTGSGTGNIGTGFVNITTGNNAVFTPNIQAAGQPAGFVIVTVQLNGGGPSGTSSQMFQVLPNSVNALTITGMTNLPAGIAVTAIGSGNTAAIRITNTSGSPYVCSALFLGVS